MEQYFTLQRHPIYNDKYRLNFNANDLTYVNTYIIVARLLGLTYANCLRLMRDQFGAQLIGKYTTDIDVLFDLTDEVIALKRLLNTRFALIIDEQKNPYIYKREEDGSITRTDFDGSNEVNSGTFKAI